MHNIPTINIAFIRCGHRLHASRTPRFDAKRSQGLRDHNSWHHLVPSSTTYANDVDPNVLPNAQKNTRTSSFDALWFCAHIFRQLIIKCRRPSTYVYPCPILLLGG